MEAVDTRQEILIQASRLFKRLGYRATTTREIAKAVNIKQPSLFHHFASKKAIVEEIFSLSLKEAAIRIEEACRQEGPASERLHQYLVWDLSTLHRMPMAMSAIYTGDALKSPELAELADKLKSFYRALEDLLEQGIRSGEFVDIDPQLGRLMVASITIAHLEYSEDAVIDDPDRLARDGADFVLRAFRRPVTGTPL
ncbi:TetR/AcrR family transcriptional regulator [Shinella oryzae]|jgi:AcrR family transcriptional regulator|uniref:TetR/AcrR family transcriptional regulator n=1 Tax=Shinella oryzae TaxID=2871820 RepID=A0ABY9KBW6_9HYPH|nr:TetR/AcrR family transcriptional regulator [Shinella oryzae]WLS05174.1 TetR/AcrR family transcriptional regulator [Shinella oryzae]